MATKIKVRKYERHLLSDFQRLQITVWTKLGGYSNRAIAARVFGTTQPSESEIRSVVGYKSRNGLKCSWWRNMESPLSKNYADSVLRIESKKDAMQRKKR